MAQSTAVRLPDRLVSGYDCELQVADDPVDCAGDTAGERRERDDDADRDDCQHDAVLGHRLTLVGGVAHAEVLDQILERHGFTPFASSGARWRAVQSGTSGCGLDSKPGTTTRQAVRPIDARRAA